MTVQSAVRTHDTTLRNNFLIHSRYRLVQHLSDTLYGAVYLCENMKAPQAAAYGEASTATSPHSAAHTDPPTNFVVLKQIDIPYAMQTLNRHTLPHSQMLDDPRQELAVANLLRRTGGHVNIVQYIDSFVDSQTLVFVLEYCADRDLFEFLRVRHQTTTLPTVDAMSVLAQVGAGVAFLHRRNIAHRDISLENVLVHNGVCKLTDFGLSTRTHALRTERVGKVYYMAPEVVTMATRNAPPYDAKAADIWSLGILLFILLTGSPLVAIADADDDKAFAAVARLGVSAVLRAWRVSHLSASITHLLEWMLQVEPLKRPTIAQVLQHRALDEWEEIVRAAMDENEHVEHDGSGEDNSSGEAHADTKVNATCV